MGFYLINCFLVIFFIRDTHFKLGKYYKEQGVRKSVFKIIMRVNNRFLKFNHDFFIEKIIKNASSV
ncbi:MAG: hypothetical protein CVU43_10595 [Chloroflexi bacterium HGW-Chloroflexi-5]|nr:MAG: hypothetical protein CVU43_10595 [Chloroflexi bacterium HGW-Chloroflexi-5]